MPFNFKEYEQHCSRLSKGELRREIEHQDEVVAAAGAGTGLALLAVPLTMGLSAVAIGGTAPAIINARKKRSIAKKYLAATGPEVGPNFSTQTCSLRPTSRKNVPSRPSVSDEELPAYTPGQGFPETREKQTYTSTEESEMDLPPSYDEATIKRMTMMGLRPQDVTRNPWSHEAGSSGSPSNTVPVEVENFPSSHENTDLYRSTSFSSLRSTRAPANSEEPRAPSSARHHAPTDHLSDEYHSTSEMEGESSTKLQNPEKNPMVRIQS